MKTELKQRRRIRTRLKRHNFDAFRLVVGGRRQIYEHFNTAEGKIGPLTSGSDMPPLLKNIGTWGRLHYDFLYRNQRSVINAMRLQGTLNDYLISRNYP